MFLRGDTRFSASWGRYCRMSVGHYSWGNDGPNIESLLEFRHIQTGGIDSTWRLRPSRCSAVMGGSRSPLPARDVWRTEALSVVFSISLLPTASEDFD